MARDNFWMFPMWNPPFAMNSDLLNSMQKFIKLKKKKQEKAHCEVNTLFIGVRRKTDKGSDHLLEKANFDEFSNCIHIQVLYIKF